MPVYMFIGLVVFAFIYAVTLIEFVEKPLLEAARVMRSLY